MNLLRPFAITLDAGSSLSNRTGSWRTSKPEYVHRLPPCNAQCPAGHDIQGWLARAAEGDEQGAFNVMMEHNPLPATMGRVCYHTCEGACNRDKLERAVNIHAIERHIGDLAIAKGWTVKAAAPTGKKVLVIGAGPAGLSAAYQLALRGHAVTVVDAAPAAGGMMRYGIPSYRLPRAVLDAEVARIKGLGVAFTFNTRVADAAKAMKDGGYDAGFVAIGAHIAKTTAIATTGKADVRDAVSFLRAMEGREQPVVGKRVAVYGGGNTAIDVARTALRLGAEEVAIVYRRTRAKMPAHAFEIEEALEEGIVLHDLRTIQSFGDGKLVVETMALDDRGSPVATGETATLAADTLILALGQDSDTAVVSSAKGVVVSDGRVEVGAGLAAGYPGLFCGGDMVPGDRTVTTAIGHGKKAARHIDAFLNGEAVETAAKHEAASFERLNTWYYAEAGRNGQPMLEPVARRNSFAEVTGPLSEDAALAEARRCLSCGNCLECDNCFGYCPDNAVIKLGKGKGYEFNFDFCKGCGVCATECPCGAIRMVAQEI